MEKLHERQKAKESLKAETTPIENKTGHLALLALFGLGVAGITGASLLEEPERDLQKEYDKYIKSKTVREDGLLQIEFNDEAGAAIALRKVYSDLYEIEAYRLDTKKMVKYFIPGKQLEELLLDSWAPKELKEIHVEKVFSALEKLWAKDYLDYAQTWQMKSEVVHNGIQMTWPPPGLNYIPSNWTVEKLSENSYQTRVQGKLTKTELIEAVKRDSRLPDKVRAFQAADILARTEAEWMQRSKNRKIYERNWTESTIMPAPYSNEIKIVLHPNTRSMSKLTITASFDPKSGYTVRMPSGAILNCRSKDLLYKQLEGNLETYHKSFKEPLLRSLYDAILKGTQEAHKVYKEPERKDITSKLNLTREGNILRIGGSDHNFHIKKEADGSWRCSCCAWLPTKEHVRSHLRIQLWTLASGPELDSLVEAIIDQIP